MQPTPRWMRGWPGTTCDESGPEPSSRCSCASSPYGPICGGNTSATRRPSGCTSGYLDDHLEVWLICWSQRQDTGFHDHDRSRGAVSVVSGALAERRLAVGGPPPPTAIYPTGAAFSFGATHIHDVSQTGAGLATSLHVYSPPLGEMGFYEVGADGMLGRRTGDYRRGVLLVGVRPRTEVSRLSNSRRSGSDPGSPEQRGTCSTSSDAAHRRSTFTQARRGIADADHLEHDHSHGRRHGDHRDRVHGHGGGAELEPTRDRAVAGRDVHAHQKRQQHQARAVSAEPSGTTTAPARAA